MRRWIMLCAAAETIGMTTAAAAARASRTWVGDPPSGWGALAALALAVAGGLVEGTALGVAQARGLSLWLTRLRQRRLVRMTVLVAGLGWAAASTPATLLGGTGDQPPLPPILAGAVGLGLAMGAVLGSAQGLAFRGTGLSARRWVFANVLAWAGAMPVIFLGATVPGAEWPAAAVIAAGTGTGAVAGGVLGAVTGRFLPSLR
jgi:hypothetical protein